MIYLNMVRLDVYPAQVSIIKQVVIEHYLQNFQAVVKVDDTTSGITAGLNAGCWTVGIAKTVRILFMSAWIIISVIFREIMWG